MKEKNREFLTGCTVALVFVALVVLIGKIGGDCVADCMENGGTEAVCYNTCRP